MEEIAKGASGGDFRPWIPIRCVRWDPNRSGPDLACSLAQPTLWRPPRLSRHVERSVVRKMECDHLGSRSGENIFIPVLACGAIGEPRRPGFRAVGECHMHGRHMV